MNNIFNIDAFKQNEIIVTDQQLKKMYKHKEMLVHWNKKINLTAILEDKEILYKHFIDSLLLLLIKEINLKEKKLIDIGTGAGFPGLPLAIMREDLKVTLSDSLKKRTIFLELVVDDLKLENINIVHGRAEDLGQDKRYRQTFDIAVARGVSKLPVLLEYTLPFLKKGGFFVAYKGPEYLEELEESKKALEELGGRLSFIKNFKIKEVEIERNLIIFEKHKNTPEKYPRRAGNPSRKPL